MKKKILIINRHAPCSTANAPDALDMLLAYSAYEHEVSVIFIDDGVFQLKLHQDTSGLQQKNFTAALAALGLYDVNNIYIEQESLQQRGLSAADLIDGCTVAPSKNLALILAQQDIVINF